MTTPDTPYYHYGSSRFGNQQDQQYKACKIPGTLQCGSSTIGCRLVAVLHHSGKEQPPGAPADFGVLHMCKQLQPPPQQQQRAANMQARAHGASPWTTSAPISCGAQQASAQVTDICCCNLLQVQIKGELKFKD